MLEKSTSLPRLYIIQTTMVHPLAELFDEDFISQTAHPARAIIDRIAHRKGEAASVVKKSGGGGYVISKEDLESSGSIFQNVKNVPGPESLLTLAALQKHRRKNPPYTSAKSMCIFTS